MKDERQETRDEGRETRDESLEAIETLAKVINQEEGATTNEKLTLKTFVGGDVLQYSIVKKMVVFTMFVVLLALIYTGNTYVGQQKEKEIDSLRRVLQEEQYKALTQSSVLLGESSLTQIEELLKQNGDSALTTSDTPPIIVK